jgi:hypothetical protein
MYVLPPVVFSGENHRETVVHRSTMGNVELGVVEIPMVVSYQFSSFVPTNILGPDELAGS